MSITPEYPPVNNPCNICLETVTLDTGLQCEGACNAWTHFCCLNFTEGTIADIKAGVIKVNCPCTVCRTLPDAETLLALSTDNQFAPFAEYIACPSCSDIEKPEYGVQYKSTCANMGNNNQNSKEVLPGRCNSGCSSSGDVVKATGIKLSQAGDGGAASPQKIMEKVYKKLGKLSIDVNELMCTIKQVLPVQRGKCAGGGGSGGGIGGRNQDIPHPGRSQEHQSDESFNPCLCDPEETQYNTNG